jgi:hypothetical protein
MEHPVFTSGQVAGQVGMPRWKLVYLIEKGEIPGPSFVVPGRRLFTAADIENILKSLNARPDLRGAKT